MNLGVPKAVLLSLLAVHWGRRSSFPAVLINIPILGYFLNNLSFGISGFDLFSVLFIAAFLTHTHTERDYKFCI